MRPASLCRQCRIAQHQRQQSLGRRHGSNTPGPLEARKRASRRKYAAAVATTASTIPADIGTLLSIDPSRHSIDRLRSIDDQTIPISRTQLPTGDSHVFPSQLLPTQQPIPQPTLPPWLSNALKELRGGVLSTVKEPELEESSLELWRAALPQCRNLNEILAAATRLSIALADPIYSRAAFEQLLKLRLGHETVVKFLSDRSLSPVAAFNLTRYLHTLTRRVHHGTRDARLAKHDLRRLRKWTIQEIRLGSMAEEEVRDVLRWTAKQQRMNMELGELLWKQTIAINEGFKESNVQPVQQLQPATIRRMLYTVACSANICLQARCRLARDLVNTACRSRPELYSRLTSGFLRALEINAASGRTNSRSRESSAMEETYKFFQATSPDPPQHTMKFLLDTLPKTGTSDHLKRRFQLRWLNAYLQKSDVSSALRQELATNEAVMSGVEMQSLFSIASHETIALILQLLPPSASINFFGSYFRYSIPSPKAAKDVLKFSEIQTQTSPDGISLEKGLLFPLQTLPQDAAIAYADLLANVLCHFKDTILLESLLRHCTDSRLPIPASTTTRIVNFLSATQPSRALSLFLADRRLRIEHSEPLVAAIIASPGISNETIFGLLGRSLRNQGRCSKLVQAADYLMVSFAHKLAAMLAEAQIEQSVNASELVAKVLDLFELRPEHVRPTLLRSFIRVTVRSLTHQGLPVESEARRDILSKLGGIRSRTSADWIEKTIQEESKRALSEVEGKSL